MAAAPDDDTDLMRRVAGDEPGAFERLVESVLPRLLGYLRRLGAGREEAEDLSQEVLLKIYRARRDYVARARFSTYLFHVARNCWIDAYRHRRAGPVVISADASAGRDDEGGAGLAAGFAARDRAAASDGEGAALRQALERCLRTLSPEHREAFVLSQLGALRYEELAEVLGVPVGTVKSRVHAAVLQVRQALKAQGFEP